jgi:hypothetical protein
VKQEGFDYYIRVGGSAKRVTERIEVHYFKLRLQLGDLEGDQELVVVSPSSNRPYYRLYWPDYGGFAGRVCERSLQLGRSVYGPTSRGGANLPMALRAQDEERKLSGYIRKARIDLEAAKRLSR